MSELAPKVEQIKVAPQKLVLDPNNPRLISRDEDIRIESEALDLLPETLKKIEEGFKVDDLVNSIKENGWVPVDFIFVKKLDGGDRYLVLEGNRRVAAIRMLLSDPDTELGLKKSLEELEVMEITDKIPEEELRKKITYLLGVRHHGSLKTWTPFAQAHNIYLRYLELAEVGRREFTWSEEIGQHIANALSIELKEVKERLKVYRAMEQIGNLDEIKKSEAKEGGIKDRYYSVIGEVLLSGNKALKSYIKQNPSTFLLDSDSLKRIVNLCHFDTPKREGSPIVNVPEWRALGKILADPDPDERKEMLERVEVLKQKPSDVYAKRSVELQKLRWDKWLGKVNAVLSRVNLGDDLLSVEARETTAKLLSLIELLEEKRSIIGSNNMLQNLDLNIKRLMLDPNNPRFIKHLRNHEQIDDENIKGLQRDTLNKFSNKDIAEEEDAANISDLYRSMRTIGFVPIDRIVVRRLADSEDYLVIEGNRRIATVKKILSDLEKRRPPFHREPERKRIESLLDSFKTITCMLLDTTGMSEEEVRHRISVILGLRHHGSLLPWEPLPRAYNCYKEYMGLEPLHDCFERDSGKIGHVSAQLSISTGDVIRALETYVVFMQLSELFTVKDNYYSLIEAGVTNRSLKNSYFKIDDLTFQMDDPSIHRMNNICQFGKRDNINPTREKKILNEPKSFAKLGKLIAKRRKSAHEAIKRYADDLIERVEDEQDLDMTLDQAVDDLTNTEASVKWIETVNALLTKQEKELPVAEYSGTGNDRANKDEVKNRVEPLKRILGL